MDDHPLTRKMLRQILKQLGFEEIVEAHDGDMALEILGDEDISLVFTDLNMPTVSGLVLI